MEATPSRPFPVSTRSRSTSTSCAAAWIRGNRSDRNISRIFPSRVVFRVSIPATGTSTSTVGMTCLPAASRARTAAKGRQRAEPGTSCKVDVMRKATSHAPRIVAGAGSVGAAPPEEPWFPRIHATAHDVDVERLRVETGKGREGVASIGLLLRIRDVERKVRATAGNLKESGERITFDLEFPVSLGEFDLKPPSVLGIIRVGDKVSVKATFTLTVSRSP